jgi:F-type H+-transporting ATPase subunit epsilon
MKLTVATPERVVVEAEGVAALRAEDATGSFGLRPGHADLLTVLVPTVITWRGGDGAEHYVAVRGGVMTVSGGDRIEVATRQAVAGDDYDVLDAALEAEAAEAREEESRARTEAIGLEGAAVRALESYLRAASGARRPGGER